MNNFPHMPTNPICMCTYARFKKIQELHKKYQLFSKSLKAKYILLRSLRNRVWFCTFPPNIRCHLKHSLIPMFLRVVLTHVKNLGNLSRLFHGSNSFQLSFHLVGLVESLFHLYGKQLESTNHITPINPHKDIICVMLLKQRSTYGLIEISSENEVNYLILEYIKNHFRGLLKKYYRLWNSSIFTWHFTSSRHRFK